MLISLSSDVFFKMKILLQIKKGGGGDLANLSLQGDKDRTSVKENIGHSYKERLSFFLREENQIRFNPFPNKPWFSQVCSKGLLKTM